MKRLLTTAFLLCLATILLSSPAMAARHALLVGIADYPHVPKLYGPVNDINSLKEVLTRTYDIPAANITTLTESRATKRNILQALAELKNRTAAGDYIFFYFSGHGTSTYDRDAALTMDNSTGALIPFDFKPVPGSAEKTLERLIIGRRDLQPILRELDKDRTMFVVFDSCYSGNAVRALRTGRGIPKFVPLDIPVDTTTFSAIKDLPLPYASLVFFAAAHQTETADDLPPRDTHDGKAHGALTDSLLVGLKGEADMNRDGNITYEELHDFSRQRMQTVTRHTPQAKSNRSMAMPVLDHTRRVSSTATATTAVSEQTRVQITGEGAAAMSKALAGIKLVRMVTEKPDLRLTVTGNRIAFYLPGGDELSTVTGVDEARKRVQRYARARELLTIKNPSQNFNLFLRPLGDEGKTVFFNGEQLGFKITSESAAHLMLLNIDSSGHVTPLLPNGIDSNQISAGTPLELANIGQIEPPLGVEYLKLFAFKTPVTGFDQFNGKTIDPLGTEFNQLLKLIRQQQGWSSTVLELVTMEKK